MDARTPAAAIAGIGYSIRASAPEFEDLPAKLDEAEALGVDFVELPAFAWTLVVDGRVLEDRLERLVAMTRDRPFGYTVHGPLAINLMSPKARLPRHEALLDAMIAISGAWGRSTSSSTPAACAATTMWTWPIPASATPSPGPATRREKWA